MTVESNDATEIATRSDWLERLATEIATRSDWLERLAPVFQPTRSKTKTNLTLYARFFPRFELVTGNCWEILIGSSRCLPLL